MDRREFIRTGALLGGAAYLGGKLPWSWAGSMPSTLPGDSLLTQAAADSDIDTIVVLMMENRSVDHYLGWLATDDAFIDAGLSRYGSGFSFNGDSTQSFLDPNGISHSTYHLPAAAGQENPYRGCGHPDPGHGWDSGRAQRDGGFLANGSGNDEFAIGYYQADDVPLYATLARRFTTFDRYHCSLLGPTFPNREYLHSAQSGGIKTNALPPEVPGHTAGFTWENIWDRLRDRAGFVPRVDAGYFFVDLPTILLWGPRMLPFMAHVEEYFAQAATGTLPKVTFLDPGFTTGLRTDDHPYADIRAGQKLVLDYVKAFVESPQWERGVMFITYDEWGGFFDHVAPPRLNDDRATDLDPGGEDDFGQAGFRVPTMALSPLAPKGFVDGALYDHTSILRFIEWRYLGAPATGSANPGGGSPWWLTERDRHASNIGASLRTRASHFDPELHLPLLPEVPVTSLPCQGEELEGTFVDGVIHDVLDELPPPPETEQHAFEKALHAGFFERMGYHVELKPLPTP